MQRIAAYSLKGVSLLELLVSLFIFSIALLGLEKLQLSNLQQEQSNYLAILALQQLDSLRDYYLTNVSGDFSTIKQTFKQKNSLFTPQIKFLGLQQSELELNWFDPWLRKQQQLKLIVAQ